MTPKNAQFSGQFNEIPLKIHTEAKIAEEKKQKRHFLAKISKNYRKFSNFTRENSRNSNSNDTDKCTIERYWIEGENRSENRTEKTTFGREN